MQSEDTYYRCILVLAIFTTTNLLIWTFSWKQTPKISVSTCSADALIVKFTEYLRENGKSSLSKFIPTDCLDPSRNSNTEENFKFTLRYLLEECKHKDTLKKNDDSIQYPLLTLFTSWMPTTTKYFVHENVLKNWGSFSGKIQLVMFTNNSELTRVVEKSGWAVLPITKYAVDGVPIFKGMFQAVMSKYNTTFYAYCNGDILFEDGLMSTLSKVSHFFNTSKPLIVVGQRTNAYYLSTEEASSYKRIQQAAITKGSLFIPFAQDYFIVTKSYPWDSVPDFIIGWKAYDNWITAHALCWNLTLIDATDSILALHQTTSTGIQEGPGHEHAEYNIDLLKSLKSDGILRVWTTSCSPWVTYRTHCGLTEIRKRENRYEGCTCSPAK